MQLWIWSSVRHQGKCTISCELLPVEWRSRFKRSWFTSDFFFNACLRLHFLQWSGSSCNLFGCYACVVLFCQSGGWNSQTFSGTSFNARWVDWEFYRSTLHSNEICKDTWVETTQQKLNTSSTSFGWNAAFLIILQQRQQISQRLDLCISFGHILFEVVAIRTWSSPHHSSTVASAKWVVLGTSDLGNSTSRISAVHHRFKITVMRTLIW